MSEKYTIERDSFHRMRAQITEDFAVGVKLLAEDHQRRIDQRIHAYVVVDIRTELGPWRIRDIRVIWSPENERHFVRYRQWRTGKVRDGRDEWLDVAGPLDRETRAKVSEAILTVFYQIKEGDLKGKPEGHEVVTTIGDNAEVAAQLQNLKSRLDEPTPPATEPEAEGESTLVAVGEATTVEPDPA